MEGWKKHENGTQQKSITGLKRELNAAQDRRDENVGSEAFFLQKELNMRLDQEDLRW
jgi:hypothetical protein